MLWRQLILADSGHGQAVETQNHRSLRGDVGATDIGSGMLAGKAVQIFIQIRLAAGEGPTLVMRAQGFDQQGDRT